MEGIAQHSRAPAAMELQVQPAIDLSPGSSFSSAN